MNMAKLVGYSNYAEMAMRHRMAGGVQEVMEFIETWVVFCFTASFKLTFDQLFYSSLLIYK